jgi:CHAD domain-containing protein
MSDERHPDAAPRAARAKPARQPERAPTLVPDARPMPQLARAILEDIAAARAALAPSADGIHACRTRLRCARSRMRLARGLGDGQALAALDRQLRAAAHRLSRLRDDDVLDQRMGDWRPASAGPGQRRGRGLAGAPARKAAVAAVDAILLRASAEAATLDLDGSWDELVDGCARTLRSALHAWRRVAADGRDQDGAIHHLRRRARDVRYQLQLLAPINPEVLQGWWRAWHRLTDLLGDWRDLGMLRARLARQGAAPDAPAAIERRRVELRVEADQVARGLAAERPHAVKALLRQWCLIWRSGRPRVLARQDASALAAARASTHDQAGPGAGLRNAQRGGQMVTASGPRPPARSAAAPRRARAGPDRGWRSDGRSA